MCLALVMLQLLCHDNFSTELSQELQDIKRSCVLPLLDFEDAADVPAVLSRYRMVGQSTALHPGHMWTLCVLGCVFNAGTPGGGAALEWSAGTLWRLLILGLEI